MKLSVSLSEALLRHITVAAFLMIILDAVTSRVELKSAFKLVPLTPVRVAVNGPLIKVSGGTSPAPYEVVRVMSGLRHSREIDLNTRQVKVTWSPGHVNRLALLEVSSTFSKNER